MKVSVTLAPSVNPDIVQSHQPKGVNRPFTAPLGAETCEKLENVPALVETVMAPWGVATLQVAPLQVVAAVLS